MDGRINKEIDSQQIQNEFLQEFIKTLSNPNLLSNAVRLRQSIKIEYDVLTNKEKYLHLHEYFAHQEQLAKDNSLPPISIEKSRISPTTLHDRYGLNLAVLKDLTMIDCVMLDAAIHESIQAIYEKYFYPMVVSLGTDGDNVGNILENIKTSITQPIIESLNQINVIKFEIKLVPQPSDLVKSSELLAGAPIINANADTLVNIYETKADAQTIKQLQSMQNKILQADFISQENLAKFVNNATQLAAVHMNEKSLKPQNTSQIYTWLIKQLDNICNSKLTVNDKFKEIIKVLEKEFDKIYKTYTPSKFNQFFSKKTPDKFIEFLNHKNNSNQHQYTKMIGLLLKDAYQINPGFSPRKFDLEKLMIPNNEIYKSIFDARHIDSPTPKPALK